MIIVNNEDVAVFNSVFTWVIATAADAELIMIASMTDCKLPEILPEETVILACRIAKECEVSAAVFVTDCNNESFDDVYVLN